MLFVHPHAPPEARRERELLMLAGLLVVAGSAALVLEQGAKLPPRLGALLGMRAVAGVALAISAAVPRLARMRRNRREGCFDPFRRLSGDTEAARRHFRGPPEQHPVYFKEEGSSARRP